MECVQQLGFTSPALVATSSEGGWASLYHCILHHDCWQGGSDNDLVENGDLADDGRTCEGCDEGIADSQFPPNQSTVI